MTRIINLPGSDSSDYYFDIASGNIPSLSLAHKFGTNANLSTTQEDIWVAGGQMTHLTTASTIEVISSDSNDTAAGTGAREITLYGIDENWDSAEETVATNGTSASTATTTTFLRVNNAKVTQTGVYGGSNTGNITIRVSSAGSTQSYIAQAQGHSQGTHYSIPRGNKGYIIGMHASVATTKTVTYKIFTRDRANDNSAPFSSWQVVFEATGMEGSNNLSPTAPIYVNQYTDIKVTGIVTAGTASAGSFDYQVILSKLGAG